MIDPATRDLVIGFPLFLALLMSVVALAREWLAENLPPEGADDED